MEVIVNGEPRQLVEPLSVAELLELLGVNERPVAVEVNFEVVPRTAHAQRRLAHGDRLEVVTLAGGG